MQYMEPVLLIDDTKVSQFDINQRYMYTPFVLLLQEARILESCHRAEIEQIHKFFNFHFHQA